MKSLTTPKAIIISGIVIALSTVLSSFITSHWLNETNKELSQIESELSGIDKWTERIGDELHQIEDQIRFVHSELSSMREYGIRIFNLN